VSVIHQALEVNKVDGSDPLATLAQVGGLKSPVWSA